MYCHKQPLKGALRNSCSALAVKNLEKYVLRTSIFKYKYCQYLKQTKQGVTILKKPQEELIN